MATAIAGQFNDQRYAIEAAADRGNVRQTFRAGREIRLCSLHPRDE
jgi:hypothetical protein